MQQVRRNGIRKSEKEEASEWTGDKKGAVRMRNENRM